MRVRNILKEVNFRSRRIMQENAATSIKDARLIALYELQLQDEDINRLTDLKSKILSSAKPFFVLNADGSVSDSLQYTKSITTQLMTISEQIKSITSVYNEAEQMILSGRE